MKQVFLNAVTLSALATDEIRSKSDPNGIAMLDSNGTVMLNSESKADYRVNVSTGERSGIERPYVVLHLSQDGNGALNRGAKRPFVYWGTNNPDGTISWNGPTPKELQSAVRKFGAEDFNLLTSYASLSQSRKDYLNDSLPEGKTLTIMHVHEFLMKFNIPVDDNGTFMEFPADFKNNPLFAGITMNPYDITLEGEGTCTLTNAKTFIPAPDLNSNKEKDLDRAKAVLANYTRQYGCTFLGKDENGDIVPIMNAQILENDIQKGKPKKAKSDDNAGEGKELNEMEKAQAEFDALTLIPSDSLTEENIARKDELAALLGITKESVEPEIGK